MINIESFYSKRLEKFTGNLNKLKKELVLLSILRLLAFALIFLSVFYLIKINDYLGIIASLAFLVLFFILIKKYNSLLRKKLFLLNLVKINSDELEALNNKYDQFESGNEFVNPDHPFTNDLDIFGNGSLFQYINRTSTIKGKHNLAERLSNPFVNIQPILDTQQALKELIPKTDTRQYFQAAGNLNAETGDDLNDIAAWLKQENRYYNKFIYKALTNILPVLSIILIILSFINQYFISFLVTLFVLQLFIVSLHLRYNNGVHSNIAKKLEMLRKYGELLKYIEGETYTSLLMVNLQNELKSDGLTARQSINKLSDIISSFDNRLNIIAGIFLNGFLLWDIQCMMRLEKWKTFYHNKVLIWIDLLGEFDGLCSLANFAFNNPDFVFPLPDTNIILDFKDAGHPLIHKNERVNNDISISGFGQFYIITGANMAGKSTFLRTVATNLLLAMTGTTVCANSASFRPLKIYSSMRTSDSLKKNESYFFAELKRLKELIDKLRQGHKLFIVLDEILKGTNSTDKQLGSRAVLRQIAKLNGTGLIATHDLDLAGMEKEMPHNLKNKCFEIEINGAEIFFDYKLYSGITQKMNASLLMKQMGILTEN